MIKSTNTITNHFFKNQIHFLKENFNITDHDLFQKFSIAVERFCYFVLEMDKLIDGEYDLGEQYKNHDNKIYHLISNHQNALQLLWDVFPADHQFWKDLDETNFRYYEILIKEKWVSKERSVLNIDDFKEYAIAKHCLAYIPIKGLCYLFEAKVESEKLEEVFTKIFLGMQMNDDIEDFNNDLINSQWTYAHSRVQEIMEENNIQENPNLDKIRERVLYVSGIGEELIGYCKESFLSAKELSKEYHLTALENWLNETLSIICENEKLVLELLQMNSDASHS